MTATERRCAQAQERWDERGNAFGELAALARLKALKGIV
jgi:hypothetical protein